MATAELTAERENYLNQEYGIKSWLLTVDSGSTISAGAQ